MTIHSICAGEVDGLIEGAFVAQGLADRLHVMQVMSVAQQIKTK